MPLSRRTIAAYACALLSLPGVSLGGSRPALADPASTVEVMHWWTSGGEAKALKVLKDEFELGGGKWIDAPVAGGGGDAARTVLKSRIVGGNPPGAAQMHMGPQVWEWGTEGVLASIDDVAKAEKWDELLPPLIAAMVKYKGKYVAAPVDVHRINWLWINPAVFAKAGVKVPATWPEFNAAAEQLRKAGAVALAHGGQPWQDLTLFDTVVLGLGGADFYRKALVDLDPAALGGPTMVQVFDQMRLLKSFTDTNSPGRDWNLATAMVVTGKAGMQIMGDWAKGEFVSAGKVPGKDFVCVATPGSKDAFSLNNDSFAMFEVKGADKQAGQRRLASLIMGEKFQSAFNLNKGSIPARKGVSRAGFDPCAIQSMDALATATAKGAVVPSFSSGLAASSAVTGAVTDVVTEHFNGSMSSADAVKKLVAAVQGAK